MRIAKKVRLEHLGLDGRKILKMDLTVLGWKDVDWLDPSHDRSKWHFLESAVVKVLSS
jgi:hypothetical protein